MKLVKNNLAVDDRGFFLKIKKKNKLYQNCFSYNEKKGTIRGIHYQRFPNYERKIITCIRGAIFDVAVDLRKNSKTYLQYRKFILTEKNNFSLIIPKGFGHGFQTLEKNTIIYYQISGKFIKKKQAGILWNDKKIKIKWPLPIKSISKRDQNFKKL
jgi:dTDP-4-dehydrorhamnose 3,5-epimerase